METWADFFNTVRIAEHRIDRQYKAARQKKDEAGMKEAMEKLLRLNTILDELLKYFQGKLSQVRTP